MAPQEKYKTKLTGLPGKLVTLGVLSESDARKAIELSRSERTPFVTYLLNKKLVKQSAIAHGLSQEFEIPLIDLNDFDINPEVIKLVDEKLLKKHKAVPLLKRGKSLFLALSDPTALDALKEIQFQTNIKTEPIIAEADKLDKFIERALDLFEFDDSGMEDDEETDFELVEETDFKLLEETAKEEETPVAKFVNSMLFKAIKMGASSLHFEPYEKTYRVRFRIDGVLRCFAKPPVAISRKLAARIKVMSRLNVAECYVPQDGHLKLRISARNVIDFWVMTCPTIWGENIVMRILDSSAAKLNINILGFEEEQKRLYLEALANPYGMILVTGPTGSGKTVTLYTGINILNKEGVNIFTAEYPVEINRQGVNQVQIDEKTGMTFANVIRRFIAQRADIILLDEIRDIETGNLAIRAANSGQMVMSTLHLNDAPQALIHLLDMGIKPFAIANVVKLIITQRLCRRLCSCKTKQKLPDSVLMGAGFTKEEIPELRLYGQGGCEKCGGSGYNGQIGIYQVLPISERIKRLIMEGGNAIARDDLARYEMIASLRASGLKKVKDGLTSLEELDRVILN